MIIKSNCWDFNRMWHTVLNSISLLTHFFQFSMTIAQLNWLSSHFAFLRERDHYQCEKIAISNFFFAISPNLARLLQSWHNLKKKEDWFYYKIALGFSQITWNLNILIPNHLDFSFAICAMTNSELNVPYMVELCEVMP